MKGWECPKCGRVYGPKRDECINCNEALLIKTQNPFFGGGASSTGGGATPLTPLADFSKPSVRYCDCKEPKVMLFGGISDGECQVCKRILAP